MDPSSFPAEVARGLEAAGVALGSRLVVAVSGGADSVALLHALHELAPSRRLALVVAHLDHGLRPDSGDDASFVAALAAALELPFRLARADVAAEARRTGGGIEEAGREARLRVLADVAGAEAAHGVALAHTRDDQAETVLLRLARGTGSAGLAGMLPRRENLYVRPLLELGRDEVLAYLAARQATWREDPSNRDLAFARNRVRHRVLPELRELNPRAAEAIARAARITGEEDAFLDALAARELVRLSLGPGALDAQGLRALPRALARRVVRLLTARQRTSLRGLTLAHVDGALDLGGSPGAHATDLPGGFKFALESGRLVLRPPAGAPLSYRYELTVPGSLEAPEAGLRIHARLTTPDRLEQRGNRVHLDAALAAGGPLEVRSRAAGDVFRPVGAPGGKRLSRYLIDRKLPRSQRAALPLVARAGRILWVTGLHVDSAAAARAGAAVALELQVEAL